MNEEFLRRIGNDLFLGGLILSNGNELYLVPLPDEVDSVKESIKILAQGNFIGYEPSSEELDADTQETADDVVIDSRQGVFEAIIKQTDLMEVEIADPKDPLKKIVVRKSQRQLDAVVSWQCFRRDNYKCRYCGRDDVPLSYDHVITWETGGANTVENGITACKKCNKTRGNTLYGDWLASEYYQRVSSVLSVREKLENEQVLVDLQSGKIQKAATKRNR